MQPDYENLGYQLTLTTELMARVKYLPTILESDFRIINDKGGQTQYCLYARRQSEGPDGQKRVAVIALRDLAAFNERLKQLIRDERPDKVACEAAIKRAQYTININELMLAKLYDIDESDEQPEYSYERSESLE